MSRSHMMEKWEKAKHFKDLHNSSEIAPPAKEIRHKKISFSISLNQLLTRAEILTDAG